VNWTAVDKSLQIDRTVKEVAWAQPGSAAGLARLQAFCCASGLKRFEEARNIPTTTALSGMSPWYHFGQVAPQRGALEAQKLGKCAAGFIEESVIRRELADNFCFYEPKYDSIDAAADWAQETLQKHSSDKREHTYTRAQLEAAKTHDALWNAAQNEMLATGKMHGWCRMYWAKKILEWSATPKEALATALYLNDRYELDGRDPNGYVGCMWSVCGIHDMGWSERPIFGKIRFMNYEGAKRKFDVEAYESIFKTPTEPKNYYSLSGYSEKYVPSSKKRPSRNAHPSTEKETTTKKAKKA